MTSFEGHVAVVGTGVIGASWCALFLSRGMAVRAFDPGDGARDRLIQAVDAAWPALVALGGPAVPPTHLLEWNETLAVAVHDAMFVQESGPERSDLKQALVAEIDALAPPSSVIASSSSGLLPSIIQATCLVRPERVLVGHPFHPAHLIPLVEVVGGDRTTDTAIADALAFYAAVGKRPIHVRQELSGHVVNRLQAALWREAYSLVERGVVSVSDVDAAITNGPGLRWALVGPFAGQHLSGGPGGMGTHVGAPRSAHGGVVGRPGAAGAESWAGRAGRRGRRCRAGRDLRRGARRRTGPCAARAARSQGCRDGSTVSSPMSTPLDLDALVAIDVHAHAEVSDTGHLSLPDALMSASAKHFKTSGSRAPSLDELAQYYRDRRMAAVVFSVDAEWATGHPPVPNEDVARAAERHPDVLIPFASIDPHRGPAGVEEARRLVEHRGVRGFKFHPTLQGFFPDDPMAFPLYETLDSLGVPALFHSGQTGIGAGTPGGSGLQLKYSNPMALDDVAAAFPGLTVIIAHPSFPWQDEALAVATHKANVYIDLSGWSPKYFPPQLVRYANTLLREKVLFGSDFPLIEPDRWLADFEQLPIRDDVRPLILKENAIRALGLRT